MSSEWRKGVKLNSCLGQQRAEKNEKHLVLYTRNLIYMSPIARTTTLRLLYRCFWQNWAFTLRVTKAMATFLGDNPLNFVAITQLHYVHCVRVFCLPRLLSRCKRTINSQYSPLRRLDTRKSFPENSTSFLSRNILQNFCQNSKTKLKMADECLETTEHAPRAKIDWVTWYGNKVIFAWQKFAVIWLVAGRNVLRYWRFCCSFFVAAPRNRQKYCLPATLCIHIFILSASNLAMSSLFSVNCFILCKHCTCKGSRPFCDARPRHKTLGTQKYEKKRKQNREILYFTL